MDLGAQLFEVSDDGGFVALPALVAAAEVGRAVPGGGEQPGDGRGRDAVIGPGLGGAQEGVGNNVFGQGELSGAEVAGEHRHQAAVFVPKEVGQQALAARDRGRGVVAQWARMGRTSTDMPSRRPGQPRAMVIASLRSAALIRK